MLVKYDELDTTAQRLYKYLLETYGKNNPKHIDYNAVAEEIGRTRSSVSYAVKLLNKKGKINIKNNEIYVV